MRVFAIQGDGKFKEYVRTPFQTKHEETVLEDWLEENPDGILEDGRLLFIGRQVTTNLGSTIDLLALDKPGNAVVVELKRDRTPRDTLAQAFEYASFVGGTKLFSHQVVVGDEPGKPMRLASGSLPFVTQADFLGSLDENGRAVFV